jgi:acetate kinase
MLRRQLDGKIDRIGLSGTNLVVTDPAGTPQVPRRLDAANHRAAVAFLLDWLEAQPVFASVSAVGHRLVHGMAHGMAHSEPERVTPKLVAELRRLDPARAKGRVIHTDEDLMIATLAVRLLHLGSLRKD